MISQPKKERNTWNITTPAVSDQLMMNRTVIPSPLLQIYTKYLLFFNPIPIRHLKQSPQPKISIHVIDNDIKTMPRMDKWLPTVELENWTFHVVNR